jgi:hypothetical protein
MPVSGRCRMDESNWTELIFIAYYPRSEVWICRPRASCNAPTSNVVVELIPDEGLGQVIAAPVRWARLRSKAVLPQATAAAQFSSRPPRPPRLRTLISWQAPCSSLARAVTSGRRVQGFHGHIRLAWDFCHNHIRGLCELALWGGGSHPRRVRALSTRASGTGSQHGHRSPCSRCGRCCPRQMPAELSITFSSCPKRRPPSMDTGRNLFGARNTKGSPVLGSGLRSPSWYNIGAS